MSTNHLRSLIRQSPTLALTLALRQRLAADRGAFSVPVALMLMIVGVVAAAAFRAELLTLVADAIANVRTSMGL